MRTSTTGWQFAGFLLLALASCGCATVPYRYRADTLVTANDAPLRDGESQVDFGKPRPIIDGIGWVVGIPSKIILWDRRIDNHHISQETADRLEAYLAENELDKVKVRLNQYDPCGEWRRLARNRSVGWPLRYTLGTVSLLDYTILPGRIFGGDNYNPYTNTVNLYSDAPPVAFHEGGHAKDFAHRTWKGTYAAVGIIPGVDLWQEAIASSDALSYLKNRGSTEDLREGYCILYPAYGTYVGSAVSPWCGDVPASLAGALGGHIVGRLKALSITDDEPNKSAPDDSGLVDPTDIQFDNSPARQANARPNSAAAQVEPQ